MAVGAGVRHAQRRQESVRHRPVEPGTPPACRVFGVQPGADPVRGHLASRISGLDADAFESALGRWAQECLGEGEATIGIDGKALRGIHGRELPGVRLVAAYAGEREAWYWDKRGVRGDRKESELGMASTLLAQLELQGKVVTGDALYASGI